MSDLTGAHCPQVDITCIVCCFWVSDLDHHGRGPHKPVSVFFNRLWQCFAEPSSGCPCFVCYPNCPTRGQSVIYFSWDFFCLWSLKLWDTVDCGTKFRVIGDDTEMMHPFDSKLGNLLHLLFLVDMVYKIFIFTFCVSTCIISTNWISPNTK